VILAALLALCGVELPWAESPALLAKATDPSFVAVQSMPVVLHRDLWDPLPKSDDAAPALPGEWLWMGRRVAALDPPPLDSTLRGSFGNEVGDELFREIDAIDAQNRTPEMLFNLATPRVAGARASLYFDQSDHFSDGTMGLRRALCGNPNIENVTSPTRRRAFFGENMSDQSFVGGALDGGGVPLSGAWRTGWIWLPTPAAGMLEGWRATTARAALAWGRFSWEHAEGWFERADTATGNLLETQGRISAGAGDSVLGGRAGIAYSDLRRHGSSAWHPTIGVSAELWAQLRVSLGDWSWSGYHQAGNFYLLRDTLSWRRSAGPWETSLELSGEWSDRPEGVAGFFDSSSAGIARMECQALEQAYAVRFGVARRSDAWSLSLATSPWWVVHPRAFAAIRYDTLGAGDDAPWILRAGDEVALPGVLWGWKAKAAAERALVPGLSVDASAQLDPVLGGPQSRTDLVAPLWGTSLGARFHHRSGLSVRPLLLWRSDATLRHRSPTDWTVPGGPDASLWIDQDYFQGRLTFSFAALNVFSDDAVETPNAAQDRFRILVQVVARPF